jgi:hypothetical protein
MNELQATIPELKKTIKDMYSFVNNELGPEKKLTLKTAISDLGVADLDMISFLMDYEEVFKGCLAGLNYDEYFDPPPTWKDYLLFPVRLVTFPVMLLPRRYTRRFRKLLYPHNEPERRLTIGDLVLSAIAGKFVKREQTKIIIKSNN